MDGPCLLSASAWAAGNAPVAAFHAGRKGTAGQGARGTSNLCPSQQLFLQKWGSIPVSLCPVPLVFMLYPECFFPVSSPDTNCQAEFLEPEFSRTLPLVSGGVPFGLTPSCSLDPDHRSCSGSGWEGLGDISRMSHPGSAVGSERVTQGRETPKDGGGTSSVDNTSLASQLSW